MTVPTHIFLGAKIFQEVSLAAPYALNKRWFIYGNIYPDLSRYQFSAPHFAQYSMDFVKGRIESLCRYPLRYDEQDAMLSFHLGVLCHFISDFFCHVHCVHFSGSLAKHLLYELRQQSLITRQPRLIARRMSSAHTGPLPADVGGILRALESAQSAYLSAAHRMDTDLILAVKVSALIAASTLTMCVENAQRHAVMPRVAIA